MRILINDFGGYPFPIQLSKFLAQNNYIVAHTYISNIKTPHGNMEKSESDSENFQIIPIALEAEFEKYSFIGRYKGELEFAGKLIKIISKFKPDIVLSANTPLFAQTLLLKACKKNSIKFVYWCQDIHSIAITSFFKNRIPVLGSLIGWYFKKLEIKLLRNSNYIITISDEFNKLFKEWGLLNTPISVIHNWGPIDEIALKPKSNSWSKSLNIDSKQIVLYSGTLGLKHNPLLIAKAAGKFKTNTNILFIVISEGIGAEILKKHVLTSRQKNLLILPYQPYKMLPEVLGSADILLSILENDAALFSVPSKVLTYMCSKKPILLSVPKNNLSAKIIIKENAGLCVEPHDFEGLDSKILQLLNDEALRNTLGINGRKYAEKNFTIPSIAENFIQVFDKVLS